MTYLSASGLADAVMYLLLPIWFLAATLVGRVVARRTARGVRGMALAAAGAVTLALLVVAGRLVSIGLLAAHGWVFAADRRLLTTLLVTVPAAAACGSAARLLTVARRAGAADHPSTPTTLTGLRAPAAAPAVVLPVQVAAVASAVAFFERYLPAARPFLLNLLVYGGGVAAAAVLLRLRARRRAARVATTGEPLRATRRDWIRRAEATAVVGLATAGLATWMMQSTRLPDTYDMMRGRPDLGGGSPVAHPGHGPGAAGTVSVTDLTGPETGEPDRRITLTAQETTVRLSSGATVPAWTFNGQAPGPELRLREGELVEVTLVNQLPDQPVATHWHGVDVPNREDGVPGVTQDAVAPGQRYTYRFRVEETGTRWYHSHQAGSVQVLRGLFGPLALEPAEPDQSVDADVNVVLHDWDLDGDPDTDNDRRPAIGTADTLQHQRMPPDSWVRLRVVNTSQDAKTVTLTGTPYRVTALDGTDLASPEQISDRQLVVGAASRYDLEFTMPDGPVRLADAAAPHAGILFSPDGTGALQPKLDGPVFDPTTYGTAGRTPFDAGSAFDRTFEVVLDEQYGFYDGAFVARMTVNGEVFPNAPMHMVKEGELVRMRFVNRGDNDHPMHVHGHHFLVLSRDGQRPAGSPLWLDTINVRPGETWEIGFRADNPGVWMDHCHNFDHAQQGMVLHLAYEHMTAPFVVGGQAHNDPQ